MSTVRTVLDLITVNPDTGEVGWRIATIVEEGTTELSKTYHRVHLEADINAVPFPPEVVAAVNLAVVRTPEKAAAALARRLALTGVPPPTP